jgi:hypothetical protein
MRIKLAAVALCLMLVALLSGCFHFYDARTGLHLEIDETTGEWELWSDDGSIDLYGDSGMYIARGNRAVFMQRGDVWDLNTLQGPYQGVLYVEINLAAGTCRATIVVPALGIRRGFTGSQV